jgi:hypothetical protein
MKKRNKKKSKKKKQPKTTLVLNYNEALQYVKETKGQVYSFSPNKEGNKVVGGEIFYIQYCQEHDEDPEEYSMFDIDLIAGDFDDIDGEVDHYSDISVPQDAKKLIYKKTTISESPYEYSLGVALDMLKKNVI